MYLYNYLIIKDVEFDIKTLSVGTILTDNDVPVAFIVNSEMPTIKPISFMKEGNLLNMLPDGASIIINARLMVVQNKNQFKNIKIKNDLF